MVVANVQYHVVVLYTGQVRYYIHVVRFFKDIYQHSRYSRNALAFSGKPPMEIDRFRAPGSFPAVTKDQDVTTQQFRGDGV